MFKPKVVRCEVEDDGETMVFYVREPSGREILNQAKEKKDKPAIDNARDMFGKYIVHEGGEKLSAEDVEEMLDMRLTAMMKVSDQVQEKIGLKAVTEKKD